MSFGKAVACAIWLCGCAETEPELRPAPDCVEISGKHPVSACVPLGAAEVHSRNHDESSLETLRLYARQRQANYVALESFTVIDEDDAEMVRVRASIYRCPALVRVPCGIMRGAPSCHFTLAAAVSNE
jgi:hypothetical protein